MKKRIFGMLAAAILVSGTASAGFLVVPPPGATPGGGENPPPVAASPEGEPAVVQEQVVSSPRPNTYQDNGKMLVPLSEAMRLLAPEGWQGYADPTMDWTYPVEVNVYVDWKESLAELSNRYNLVFQLNEQLKRLYVTTGPGGIRSNTPSNINATLGEDNTATAASSPAAAAPATPPEAEVAQKEEEVVSLRVSQGQRLAEALDSFLKQRNMTLVWEAGSEPLQQSEVIFSGTLPDILTEMLHPLGYHATIHTQSKIVVVRTLAQMKTTVVE